MYTYTPVPKTWKHSIGHESGSLRKRGGMRVEMRLLGTGAPPQRASHQRARRLAMELDRASAYRRPRLSCGSRAFIASLAFARVGRPML